MKKTILLFLFCFSTSLQAIQDAEELKREVCADLPKIHGWCSKEKAINFIDLVMEVKPGVCVEIGVFAGSSVFPVASALKLLGHGVIIAIDPWEKFECIKDFDPVKDQAHLEWWAKVDLDEILLLYINMLKKYELFDQCITLRSTSKDAAPQIDFIDILYIDGNHSEASSTQDVNLYLPKVRSGGYIWLDDLLWPGTLNAKRILLASCDVVKAVDNGNCMLFKKR